MNTFYALIDCNNFYASCERVFAPQYRNTPLVVLSNNDGCIIARSSEAKKLQIPMGAPFYKVEEELKPKGVKVFSSNYALYGNLSNRIMSIIKSLCPQIEVYSIDEAFVKINYTNHKKLEKLAHELHDKIYQWVGIPVTVGVGRTKTLAKLAAEFSKHSPQTNHIVILTDPNQEEIIRNKIAINDVWGIGRGYSEQLKKLNVSTAQDFTELPFSLVQKLMGVVGYRTYMELKGLPCLELEDTIPLRKMIMTSRSFGKAITQLSELKEAVVSYTARCAEKLRKENQVAGVVTVFIQTYSFNQKLEQNNASYTLLLSAKTADTSILTKQALKALNTIFKPNIRYKKAGVLLSELSPFSGLQTHLFEQPNNNIALWKAVDTLNKKHGISKIKSASEGLTKDWKMRSGKRSPHYTTKWNELLVVS